MNWGREPYMDGRWGGGGGGHSSQAKGTAGGVQDRWRPG